MRRRGLRRGEGGRFRWKGASLRLTTGMRLAPWFELARGAPWPWLRRLTHGGERGPLCSVEPPPLEEAACTAGLQP
eukprot:7626067-Pyramimonas_sp.AAC.1